MRQDVVIIGAGIVGLSTAWQLLNMKPGLRVTVLEKEAEIAKHQTGNNSGVIHSGVYYTPGSAKAINCKRGYQLLLDFCDKEGIPYDLCGKIIVATEDEELPLLHEIYKKGIKNGLEKIHLISAGEIKAVEPHSTGIKGIRVPEAGIIDYREVAKKLSQIIIANGAYLGTNQTVTGLKNGEVITKDKTYATELIINCAGLYSDKIARMTHPDLDIKILPFRGEYFVLKPEKADLVNGLIYPVPDPAFPFLGVHLHKKIDGTVEAGPNAVLAFRREGYSNTAVYLPELFETLGYPGFRKIAKKYWRKGWNEIYRSFSKKAFTKALQKLIPEIRESDLVKGGAGVRAQACDINGNLLNDFYFVEDKGVIHVCNAPSPAATSGLAIGETIAQKAIGQLE
ncbi:MAG: L-2-hydroxyglutarate oxidase [Bacteroidota bacterium]